AGFERHVYRQPEQHDYTHVVLHLDQLCADPESGGRDVDVGNDGRCTFGRAALPLEGVADAAATAFVLHVKLAAGWDGRVLPRPSCLCCGCCMPVRIKLLRALLLAALLTGFWLPGRSGAAGEGEGAAGSCNGPFVSVSLPLNDLGAAEYVRLGEGPTGFTGGLYPGGANVPPAEHYLAGLEIAAGIVPLNSAGNPAVN